MEHSEPTLDVDVTPAARQDFVETTTRNLLASQARVLKLEAKLAEARAERAERLRLLLDIPEELGEAPSMYAVAKMLGISKQAVAKIRRPSPEELLESPEVQAAFREFESGRVKPVHFEL